MEKLKNGKIKVVFVGIPDMAIVCLNNLLAAKFNIVGVVPPKKSHEAFSFFKQFVLDKGLNFIEFEKNPNDIDCLEKIRALDADIGVVCSYNNLLTREFLETTKMGYINSHPSLLPEYRGANPYFNIINNGEKKSGITLHFMDETFDTGDIIYQKEFELLSYETMGTLFNRTTYMISDALIEVLNEIQENGNIKRIPQEKGNFNKAPKVDGNFRIRWKTSTVFEIERLIRASNPFYNVLTDFRGVCLKVIKASAIEAKHNFELGKIIKADKKCLIVAAKEGALAVEVMQVGTWGYFTPKEFYCTFSPKIGEYLI